MFNVLLCQLSDYQWTKSKGLRQSFQLYAFPDESNLMTECK